MPFFPCFHPSIPAVALLLALSPALSAVEPPEATAAPAPAGRFLAGKGLTAELVSDAITVRPGTTFHLGLWIRHEPGYHTYWKNPGLAGVPTRLTAALPSGFTTGEMIYAVPDKVKMAAINVHGYERDVLAALPVTIPGDWSGESLEIPVEATWMCCHRTCNPGHGKFSITLKTGKEAQPDPVWGPPFQELRESQPPPLTGWSLEARRLSEKAIELTASPPPGLPLPEHPQFFSDDNLICSHPRQDWQKTASGGWKVELELSDFLPKATDRLRGLIHATPTLISGTAAPYASVDIPISETAASLSPAK